MNESAPSRSPQTLIWVVALLTLPFVVATLLHLSGWRPPGTVNRGELVVPPRALPAEIPRGQWAVIMLHDAPCGLSCLERLDALRRVRTALGRRSAEIAIVWAGNGVAGAWRRASGIVAVDCGTAPFFGLPAGSLLVADPDGRAVLRYGADAPADAVRHDLQFLLHIR